MIDPCLTCWRYCSHPHTHHTLACRSTGRVNCLFGAGQTPASWSLLSPFAFSSLLSLFLPSFFLFRTYLFLFRTSLSSQNIPLSLFPYFFISQNVSPHRTNLTLSLARFYGTYRIARAAWRTDKASTLISASRSAPEVPERACGTGVALGQSPGRGPGVRCKAIHIAVFGARKFRSSAMSRRM